MTKADSTQIKLFTLKNHTGATAQFSNYGGRWLSMLVPDKDGKIEDVVLGFDDIGEYMSAAEKYHGAVTGRVCGRINNAGFELNGKTYRLAHNDSFGQPEKNHLHGGVEGFHKKIWKGEYGTNEKNEQYVEFSRISPDGEEGYPGNLDIKVRYTLTDENAVVIDCRAVTDKATLVNITNHAFFNLSGNPAESVSDHLLQINADNYLPCDGELIPTGEIASLKGLPINFSIPEKVGANLHADFPEIVKDKGFSIAYIINRGTEEMTCAAKLTHPESGRTLEIYSNQPGLQVYNAWLMDGSDTGKRNIPYGCGAGIALETQAYPDAPNHDGFPSIKLEVGEVYHHKTIYKFGIFDSDLFDTSA